MGGRLGRWFRVLCGPVLLMASLGGAALFPSSAAGGAALTSSGLTSSAWGAQIQQLAVPANGCFSATYPTIAWQHVQCHAGPGRPFAPRRTGPIHAVIGTGKDYSAKIASGSISTATGSFPYVSPGSTEKGLATRPNTFSLQLNTEFFSHSAACDGAKVPSNCLAWQQFLYASTTPGNYVFMQYWLLTYDATCPAGWYSYDTTCYVTSSATLIPTASAPTIATLSSVSLTGTVHVGGKDSVVMKYGTKHASAVGGDSMVDLAGNWTIAEFGIFGDGTGSQAKFSSGTTLDVKTSVDNGAPIAPICDFTGFTGETNNLSFTSAPTLTPGPDPAIETQQTSAGGTPGCAAARALTVPAKPAKPSAKAGDAKASVTWTAPTTGGAPITKYVVTSSPTGKTCSWTSGPLQCTVSGLTNGTPYTFTVKAHNSVGTSAPSGPSKAVTPKA